MILDSIPLAAGVIAVLLGCSAFFSASEIAIFSLERHRLSQLLERPGAAAVRVRLTFEDSSTGGLFELAAVLHRGWDDLQLYSSPDKQVPSGLVTRLDAIASTRAVDPQPERTLIDREVLRA